MIYVDMIEDARPNPSLDMPPYKAVLFSSKTGWSGVLNGNGINCLTFKSYPGLTIAPLSTAKLIAEKWNTKK